MANQVRHVITTIERGGAENQLVVLVREQIKVGLLVEVIPLKGNLDLLQAFELMGARVDLTLHNLRVPLQILKLRKFERSGFVTHAHLPRAELISRLAMKHDKLVVSRHNAEKFLPNGPKLLSNLLSRFVLLRCQSMIAISQAVRDYSLEVGDVSKSQKIDVIHYGYDSEIGISDISSGSVTSEVITRVCTVGRIVPQKDYPTLLAGFAKAHQKSKGLLLSIAGDGLQMTEMQELARQLDVQGSIFWLGRVSDVQQLLSESQVFILASRYEGFGLVFLEAIQSGITILSSSSAAAVEVLGVNYPGFFSPGDAEMLSELIEKCNDKVFRQNLRSKAKSRLDRFRPEKMAQDVLEVYLREGWSKE
jgi:glycosyltransferase involved in cell wall biosynthesis